MTQLMGRPIVEVPGELGARPVLADLLTGARAALLGLAAVAVPVLALWVVTPYADDGAAGALRLAGALWLLGHGAPVLRGAAQAPLTVTPLLLGLLAVVQLRRAGARVAARSGPRPRWGGPWAVWCGYCAVAGAVVAQCAGPGPFRARVLPDVLVVAALAAVATRSGARAVRRPGPGGGSAGPGWPGHWRRWLDRVPGWARPDGGAPAVRAAALAAGAGLTAAGALVVAVAAVLAAVDGAGPAAAVLARGPAAVAGLLLLSLAVLPNAVVWGAAYALGPGFAVGEGTLVAPAGAVLGPVPDFPLFALVAEPGAGGWRLAACTLPALAGVVPALVLGRAAAGPRWPYAGEPEVRGGDGLRPEGGSFEDYGLDEPDPAEPSAAATGPWHPVATAVAVLVAALLTGAAAMGLGWLAGGALAGGRMAELGPVPWRTGLAAAGWVAAVAVPGALLARSRALAGEAAGKATGATGEGTGAAPRPVGTVGRFVVTLTGRARRSGLWLRSRAYVLVLWLSGAPTAPDAVDGPDGPSGPPARSTAPAAPARERPGTD
ncbi:DUF6350 family protein [Kitasatospora sp. A2-31]|uniref:cell division protein PerM n=1 Tax=Kitasatospora sp. A2-31 TaxID=2916414 RepID=UPI001EEC720B|nr:DUF6350 family protein [Kitasatospora sp. A2-31]MCG6496490.1 DUF6350 family protein [Kitasatospora sp. A2-31]